MKVAINYSPEAASLLRSGDVAVDLLKCPDWDELIRDASEVAPVYVHFPLAGGSGVLVA